MAARAPIASSLGEHERERFRKFPGGSDAHGGVALFRRTSRKVCSSFSLSARAPLSRIPCVRFFAGHLPRLSRKIILFIKELGDRRWRSGAKMQRHLFQRSPQGRLSECISTHLYIESLISLSVVGENVFYAYTGTCFSLSQSVVCLLCL